MFTSREHHVIYIFILYVGPAASVKHKINLVWPNQYQIDVSNVMTAVRNSRYRQLVQRYLMLLQTVECFLCISFLTYGRF